MPISDNPLDRIPAHDRVSIRAVLVRAGEDPGPALARAGIFDPIAIPVVVGDSADLVGGILGDGVTPNVTAVLETDHQDAFDHARFGQPTDAGSQFDPARPARPATVTLPAAFGFRSFAPVRRLGDDGRPAAGTGRYGYRDGGFPPTPSLSFQADPTGTAGWRKPYLSLRTDPTANANQDGLTTAKILNTDVQSTANDGMAAKPQDDQGVPDTDPQTGKLTSLLSDPAGIAWGADSYASAGNASLNATGPLETFDRAQSGGEAQPTGGIQLAAAPKTDPATGERLLPGQQTSPAIGGWSSKPAPALEGDPYNPDVVQSRVKPPYAPNPAHDPAHPMPGKTLEPADAAEVYKRAIRGGNTETFYGVGQDGQIYRYLESVCDRWDRQNENIVRKKC